VAQIKLAEKPTTSKPPRGGSGGKKGEQTALF
jgi:hypothetical protein